MPLTSTLILVFKFMESKCLFTNNRGRNNVDTNSCKAPEACKLASDSDIGKNSCNFMGACQGIGQGNGGHAVIGNNSCNGMYACDKAGQNTKATIGNASCSDYGACNLNKGTIEDNSCNGGNSCKFNEGIIDNGCCNYGKACNFNKGHIKQGSDECCGTPKRWTDCFFNHWCGWDEKEVSRTSDGCHWPDFKIQCQKQTSSC